MNELLKAKYYSLIQSKDFTTYESVGKILAVIENNLIASENKISKDKLIELLEPIKDKEQAVYDALVNDINTNLIYGGSNNDGEHGKF